MPFSQRLESVVANVESVACQSIIKTTAGFEAVQSNQKMLTEKLENVWNCSSETFRSVASLMRNQSAQHNTGPLAPNPLTGILSKSTTVKYVNSDFTSAWHLIQSEISDLAASFDHAILAPSHDWDPVILDGIGAISHQADKKLEAHLQRRDILEAYIWRVVVSHVFQGDSSLFSEMSQLWKKLRDSLIGTWKDKDLKVYLN